MNNMKIRESLQLTQVKVANDLKLSRQVYNFYENGKEIQICKTLLKFAYLDFFSIFIKLYTCLLSFKSLATPWVSNDSLIFVLFINNQILFI